MCHMRGKKKKSNDLPGYALTVKKTIHSIENKCNKTKAIQGKQQSKMKKISGKIKGIYITSRQTDQ